MKHTSIILVLLDIYFLTNAQSISFPPSMGKYLGQKSPGMKAVLFAEGVVSTDSIEHSSPVFSPDGDVVLWTKIFQGRPAFLVEMRRKEGVWSKPATPSFASEAADDFYPDFSVDGKHLFFSSRRPLPPGYPKNEDMWIWMVERKMNGWGTPVPLDTSIIKGFEYAPSVSAKGTIYFSSRRPGSESFDIFFATSLNNKYGAAVRLDSNINTAGYEDGPFIAPDERYLIFESDRAGSVEGSIDLFICFKQKDGGWSKPKNMGPKINSKYSERFGRVSPDGRYFFFGSNRKQKKDNLYFDIYWISAKIIDELKSQ